MNPTVAAISVAVAVTTFAAAVATRPVVPVRLPLRTGTTLLSGLLSSARRPRGVRRLADAMADDVPDAVDLIAVAAMAGCNVRLAVDAGARRHFGPTARFLAQVIACVEAGDRLGDALTDLLASQPPAAGRALRPLVAVLVDSDRYGTPLGPALERLTIDLRIHRRHRAEARARRVPVRMLLPLVLCVLPSFALLTVAPLLAGVARGALADAPSTSLDQPKEIP